MEKRLVVISLVIIIFLLAIFQIRNYDIWWHLKSGEEIVSTKSIPQQDTFSHSAYGYKWVDHEWLSQVIFFSLFQLFGINGLILFKACLVVTAFILLLRIGLLRGANLYSIGLVILLAVLVARFRLFVRPHIFTFLLIAIYLYIIYYPNRRYLFLLPILMLLWVNLHPGFIFGLMLVLLYFLNEVLKKQQIKYLLIVMLFTFFASFINPYTYHLYGCFVSFSKLLSIYPIAEYRSPDFYNYSLFFSMLVLTFIVVVINWKKIDLLEFLPPLCFSILSIIANRNIPLFALSSIPLLARHISLLSNRLQSKIKVSSWIKYLIWLLISFFVLIGSIGGKYNWFFMNRCGSSTLPKFGLGIEERIYPIDGVKFIQQNRIHGKMYNSHSLGGFLIYKLYPSQKVFFDGRNLVYEELIRNFWTKSGWSKLNRLFETYSIDYAIVAYSDIEILNYLNGNPNWELVYWDDVCSIYLKGIPKYKDIIAKFKYQYLQAETNLDYLTKYFFASDEVKNNVEEEIKRSIKTQPTSFKAHFLLGYWSSRVGRLDEAIAAFQQAIALYPHSPEIYNNLGIVYGQKKLYHEAIKEFKKALSLDRNFKPAKENLKKIRNIFFRLNREN